MSTVVKVTRAKNEGIRFPAVALRGLVVFPEMSLQFDVGREKSILAVREAMGRDQLIFFTAQKSIEDDEPSGKQLFQMGVVARIKQTLQHGNDGVRLYVEGLYRAKMLGITQERPFLEAEVQPFEEQARQKGPRAEALVRYTKKLFEEYLKLSRMVPPDIIIGVVKEDDCGKLADFIAANIGLDYADKQEVLEERNPIKRITVLTDILENELQVLSIENEISEKTKERIDDNQREYYLREQLKAISAELGEEDSPQGEAEEFRKQVMDAGLPQLQQEKLLHECDRLSKMPYGSHEASVIRGYLEICLDLPWNKQSKETIDLKKAERILNRDHYGLTKVKERILETLAVRKLAPDYNRQIICLVGPPGVGKTSIAKSIAKATGRNYVRVSLGGVRDESDIVGHRKTYIGSMPGRIIAALKQAGTNNPLLLLDEIDKLGQSFRGDPSSSLLEVLDPEQNATFQDHFIDMPFDLSNVLFLTTANDYTAIPGPLLDRMDVITLPSYTHEEKFHIATKHLIPKQLKRHGISPKVLRFTPAAVREMIDGYTKEAGVRNLERTIASVCRKCAKEIVSSETEEKIVITPARLETLLGAKKFKEDDRQTTDEIGVANGLAWTSVGGETMPIEVAVMDGTGKIELTGSLGDVMKESAKAAITYIRAHAAKLGIRSDFYSKCDIHIHVPEGAIPKDGPSAGITMATAITSALSGIPVRHDVAMTGEITLRGRVLPIGGLKEKSMAAYRAGMKTVIIPYGNTPDLDEVDEAVKEKVSFLPVQRADEVLQAALVRMPAPQQEHNVHLPEGHPVGTSAHICQ